MVQNLIIILRTLFTTDDKLSNNFESFFVGVHKHLKSHFVQDFIKCAGQFINFTSSLNAKLNCPKTNSKHIRTVLYENNCELFLLSFFLIYTT